MSPSPRECLLLTALRALLVALMGAGCADAPPATDAGPPEGSLSGRNDAARLGDAAPPSADGRAGPAPPERDDAASAEADAFTSGADLRELPDVPTGDCAEGETQACGLGVGACVEGRTTCAAGHFGACVGAGDPTGEDCNGVDDDCDGLEDDGLLPRLCPNQKGVCAGLLQACGGASGWQGCGVLESMAHDPRYRAEEGAADCDGEDNDCDGTVDDVCACRNGETQACGLDVGECRPGNQTCVGGQLQPCDGVGPTPERCDGVDNNCDGTTDAGCDCLDGAREACGSSVGSCEAGSRLCQDGHFGPCDAIGPTEEACNAADDDCDGQTDEGELCGADEDCLAGRCVRNRWIYEAESGAMGHEFGREEGGGWACDTAACGQGVMVYGPYTRDLDAGHYTALFRMRVDNNNADNNSVVRIEVNDFDGEVPDCGDCILARRDVRRREFAGAQQDQDLALDFVVPQGGHRMEFRTFFYDIAYVLEDRIEVRRR